MSCGCLHFFNEGAAVGDVDPQCFVLAEPQVFLRHLDHQRIDVNDVDVRIWVVLVQEIRNRAAAQPNDQNAFWFLYRGQGNGHDAGVSQLQPIGVSEFDGALFCAVIVEDQRTQTFGVFDNLDRAVEFGFALKQHLLAGRGNADHGADEAGGESNVNAGSVDHGSFPLGPSGQPLKCGSSPKKLVLMVA